MSDGATNSTEPTSAIRSLCDPQNDPARINAHRPGGGERFSPIRFSLTGADPTLGAPRAGSCAAPPSEKRSRLYYARSAVDASDSDPARLLPITPNIEPGQLGIVTLAAGLTSGTNQYKVRHGQPLET